MKEFCMCVGQQELPQKILPEPQSCLKTSAQELTVESQSDPALVIDPWNHGPLFQNVLCNPPYSTLKTSPFFVPTLHGMLWHM